MIRIPRMGGGGGGGCPSDLTPWQPWLYVLGKAEHRSSSVQQRLYVLEYRSPNDRGKGGARGGGGRGGQFLRKRDNIC